MGEVMREPIAEKAALHGVASQLASIRILPFSIAEFVANRDALRPVVEAQARACLATDGADVVLLGGGPFAGMAHAIELETDLPLLDGVEASIARLTGENSLWSSGNIRV
jgi:Asp/Glu/hydantoin racemase